MLEQDEEKNSRRAAHFSDTVRPCPTVMLVLPVLLLYQLLQ